jgi:hypothetical protein
MDQIPTNQPPIANAGPRAVASSRRAWARIGLRVAAVAIVVIVILAARQPASLPTSLQAERPLGAPSRFEAPTAIDYPRSYDWLTSTQRRKYSSLVERFAAPTGFQRVGAKPGSFADWLRHLPVAHDKTPVTNHRGKVAIKDDDPRIAAVVMLQPHSEHLLAGANILTRLRAEYLWTAHQRDELAFHFTSGHQATWRDWSAGERPTVSGKKVKLAKSAEPDDSRQSFCDYMETLLRYASGYSILEDTQPISASVAAPASPSTPSIAAGDIFVRNGRGQFAVMVLDVVTDAAGRTAVLLGRGGTPAQTFHILRSANGSPWFGLSGDEPIVVDKSISLKLSSIRRWK